MSVPVSLLNAIEQVAVEALPALEQIALSLVGGDPNNARIRAEALAAHAAVHALPPVARAISSLPKAQ